MDGAIEIDDGGVQIAFSLLGEAAVIVNRSFFRIELDGAIVVRDNPIQVARGLFGYGAVEEIFYRFCRPWRLLLRAFSDIAIDVVSGRRFVSQLRIQFPSVF